MTNEKYLFFRSPADEDNIGGGKSVLVPASAITGMIPTSPTNLRIIFNSLRNQIGSPNTGTQVVSDYADLTLSVDNSHIDVTTAIMRAINGNDDFIVIADDVTTFVDESTRGSGEYIHHYITACAIEMKSTNDSDAANAVTGATEATLWNSYGEGAVSTSSTPAYSQVRVGDEIISTIEIDLTALECAGNTTGDAIGLDGSASVKNAWIARYYTATMGQLYKVEFITMEAPAGTNTTTDIDIAWNSDNEIEMDGAVNGTPQINTGGFAALGWKEQTIAASPSNADYIYLVEGSNSHTGGTYNAGKIVIKFHGRATY